MPEEIHAVLVDDEAIHESKRLFGVRCETETALPTASGRTLFLRAEEDPDRLLLQLTRGGGSPVDAVILDVDFRHSTRQRLDLVDCGEGDYSREAWGFAILKTIKRIDPDLPVIMLTAHTSPLVSFEAGQESADDFYLKENLAGIKPHMESARREEIDALWSRLYRAHVACRRRAIYDHEHKDTANRFAKDYDAAEREKLATVAYYHFENELISEHVTRLLDAPSATKRIRVLDVGCGTGRVEEALSKRPDRARLEVVAVDFSDAMIHMAAEKLAADPAICVAVGCSPPTASDDKLRVTLFRAPAEQLGFLGRRFPDGFDLAVLGFGFLSYVNYTDVLPACPQRPPTTGVAPLLRDGAPLVFSVYNEDSAVYERIARLDYPDAELPIAALMDLSEGRLKVGDHYFACEAFTPARATRFLRQAGFSVVPEEVATFPTAHLMMRNSDGVRLTPDPAFPPGRFDPGLYALDRDLSAVIRDRGHYVVGVARKLAVPASAG